MGNMGNRTPEDRFRSLTDLRWGEFEAVGFGGLSDHKKLEFDLTESARAVSIAFPYSFVRLILIDAA